MVSGYELDSRSIWSNRIGNTINMSLHIPDLIRAYRTSLSVTKMFGRYTLIYEWKEWNKYYKPFDLNGKTIVDIGAGEGETAYFFFKNGAKRVIAIEPNRQRCELLLENAKKFNWDILIENKKFNPIELYRIKYDLCKIDIEGYEHLLLNYAEFPNIVVEVHNAYLIEQFEKIGYRRISPMCKDLLDQCIMTNIK
jgi:SAM-dependent methyltransferase